jgi:KaiC/GvpD/RAD55 family RecA-like ATPase
MMAPFEPAVRYQSKLKLALYGGPGSGKTYSALAIGTRLGERVCLIDTEGGKSGRARKYGSGDPFHFDVEELYGNFHPQVFIDRICEAEEQGYDVLIIDSFSHAWMGKGGVLDFVDSMSKKSRSRNKFTSGWKEATPLQRDFIDAIMQCNLHVIVTMRTKMAYDIEVNEQGKKVPRKIGLEPVQRGEVEYEFEIAGNMADSELTITKTMCPRLLDPPHNGVFKKPGEEFAGILNDWLNSGEVAQEKEMQPKEPTAIQEDKEESKSYKYLELVEKAKASQGNKIIYSDAIMAKIRKALEGLSDKLIEAGKLNPEEKKDFDISITRTFLKCHFQVDTHKVITEPMLEALMEWLRECFRQQKVIV